jgi:hypothetical protein
LVRRRICPVRRLTTPTRRILPREARTTGSLSARSMPWRCPSTWDMHHRTVKGDLAKSNGL